MPMWRTVDTSDSWAQKSSLVSRHDSALLPIHTGTYWKMWQVGAIRMYSELRSPSSCPTVNCSIHENAYNPHGMLSSFCFYMPGK